MPINKMGFDRGFKFSFILAQIIPIGKHKIVFHHIDDKLHKTESEIKVNVSNRIINILLLSNLQYLNTK